MSGVRAEALGVEGLTAGYKRRAVIHDVSVTVHQGEAVGIVGHNGAGKTTLLKSIFGALSPMGGTLRVGGIPTPWPTCKQSIRAGLAFIPAEQFVFPGLTVAENLLIARANAPDAGSADLAESAGKALFPPVWQRRHLLASTLSGGERRMLSIAMGLMWEPRVLLLDEPSLGLAPALAERLFDSLRTLVVDRGLSLLIVEQNIPNLLRAVDRVYVMREGRVVDHHAARSLAERDDFWDLF